MRAFVTVRAFVAAAAVLLGLSLGGESIAQAATPDYLRLTDASVSQLKREEKQRQSKGRDRPVFIKVGDSNTATHLSLYGLGCYRYQPTGLSDSLLGVVRRYRKVRLPLGRTDLAGASCNHKEWSNSFSRVSLVSRGGTLFDFPMERGTDFGLDCIGSNLTCEIDATTPRYAFIQFGTNEALGATTPALGAVQLEEVETRLAAIIATCRSRRVTPVVITAPMAVDNSFSGPGLPGRVIQVNTVIRQTAKENRVPLVDLWLAQSQLIGPEFNYGLDQGGIHLSSPSTPDRWLGTVNLSIHNRIGYGMNLRSYLILSALERLDRIR
ncbi:MAG: SGNH/GDSL hydrolase family protein [Solirubrobacterales bacterium]|nr:SGNH/GDSL hydrolase family protein [Solirubrobacterales bacterium]MCB8915729.1 SGNH/GDSL hydrolase family protein [Thermoleophilales bacterium]